jgi:hypothetical protein
MKGGDGQQVIMGTLRLLKYSVWETIYCSLVTLGNFPEPLLLTRFVKRRHCQKGRGRSHGRGQFRARPIPVSFNAGTTETGLLNDGHA